LIAPDLRPGSLLERLTLAMMSSSTPRAVADGARGMALRPESFSVLPTVKVPTLVIVGEHDQMTPPEDSRSIAAGIPGAQLVTIDQAGHMSNLENPDAFNEALLTFLGGLSSASVSRSSAEK
jgi:3-oxoadipate enol-lactonase